MAETQQPAAGDLDQEFEELRTALLAHCYRMVGSHHDAEDLVQETYVRARKGIDAFEGRSSLKTWLYRIATNTCLTALSHHSRRVLPSGLGAPSDDPGAEIAEDPTVAWLGPLPDAALARAGVGDPAHLVVERESVRLALVAALQYLPPRQRAALLLREVLAWPAEDISQAMDISVPAVKSLLQRARGRLAEVRPELEHAGGASQNRSERELLDRWITAFERADVAAIRDLIHDDFVIEHAGHPTWFQGVGVCIPFIARTLSEPGQWRLLPTRFNGQPAAARYLRDGSGCYRAQGVFVLSVVGEKIARVTGFTGPGLVVAAGFPAALRAGE